MSLDELATRVIAKDDELSFDDDRSRECGDDGDGREKVSNERDGAALCGAFFAGPREGSRASPCWRSTVAPCGSSRATPMAESLAAPFAAAAAADNSTPCEWKSESKSGH